MVVVQGAITWVSLGRYILPAVGVYFVAGMLLGKPRWNGWPRDLVVISSTLCARAPDRPLRPRLLDRVASGTWGMSCTLIGQGEQMRAGQGFRRSFVNAGQVAAAAKRAASGTHTAMRKKCKSGDCAETVGEQVVDVSDSTGADGVVGEELQQFNAETEEEPGKQYPAGRREPGDERQQKAERGETTPR